MVTISTNINGVDRELDLVGHESAVDVIRSAAGLRGTKLVCEGGVCGACTVQIDSTPVVACLTPAIAMADVQVTTVEGLGGSAGLHAVQRAFMAHDGLQCGFCTPGFVVNAAAFVDAWRAAEGDVAPDRHKIADALAGHLCRCGAYEGIYRAVAAACRGEHDSEQVEPARVDAEAKVTGSAVYTTDLVLPDMLEAVVVRSPVAAGVVAPIPESATDYVVDLLGEDRVVRWAGQPIAAVAAASLAEARRLAADIAPRIEAKPFVIDPAEAKRDGAPVVVDGVHVSAASHEFRNSLLGGGLVGSEQASDVGQHPGRDACRRGVGRALPSRTRSARSRVGLRRWRVWFEAVGDGRHAGCS